MPGETNLIDLQLDLAARLAADEYFADLTILTEKKADIATEILNSLGTLTDKTGKVGACVIVMSLVGNLQFPDVGNSPLLLEPTIRVLEDPVINNGDTGTQKPALAIARRIIRMMHLYAPVGIASCLTGQKSGTLVPVADPLAPLAYEVRFQCMESDASGYQKAAMPILVPAEGAAPQTVTVTSATAGASIYYTIDGSFPSAVNPTAILYSAPIALAAAATLRAAAYKTGYIASNTNQSIYT
jgi:hypothetical protein